MSPEKDKELCEKYPGLYADRHAPATKTCMCWGFTFADGWFDLVDRLSARLASMIAALPEEEHSRYRVFQAKEKFGGLRFSLHGSTEEMREIIHAAEEESYKICEVCGAPGRWRNRRWIRTLCDAHDVKDEAVDDG